MWLSFFFYQKDIASTPLADPELYPAALSGHRRPARCRSQSADDAVFGSGIFPAEFVICLPCLFFDDVID